MKTRKKIPYLPGWIAALGFGILALFTDSFVVALLPIGISIVIVLYCLLHLWAKKKPKPARLLKRGLTGLVIIAVLIFCVTGALILHAGRGNTEQDCPYIIVLGAQVREDGPSATLRERIVAANDYLQAHPDTVAILSGGQGSDEPMTEASCMYKELVAMGIDPDRLILEEQATSTWGNLSYSLEIIQQQTGEKPDTLGVVSSEFHLFRAGLQAKDLDLDTVGIPAKTGSFPRWLSYFIREIAGIWHFILLGGHHK